MKKLPILFIAILITINGFSFQTSETAPSLTYSSEIEKDAFEQYFSTGTPDYFKLFYSIEEGLSPALFKDALANFNSGIAGMNLEKVLSKKPASKINYIYPKVHKKFFDKYEAVNYFSQIFQDGRYNCVSATAMYGIVFEQLGIPYVIKELPTHVFIVAYPEAENILVESTDAQNGVVDFPISFKKNYVEGLRSQKRVGDAEMNSTSVEALFDKYYFSEVDISLKQLIGIQYMNDAIYHIQNKDMFKAFHQAEKAMVFYQDAKIVNMVLIVGLELMNTMDYDSPEKFEILKKLIQLPIDDLSDGLIIVEWGRIVDDLLTKRNRVDEADKMFNELLPLVVNEEIKDEMWYQYYWERGRLLYNSGEFESSIGYFGKALEQFPDHIDIQNAIMDAIQNSLNYEDDPEKRLSKMHRYQEDYSYLKEHKVYQSALANEMLQTALILSYKERIAEANKTLIEFEQLVGESNALNVNSRLLGETYSSLVTYYFRKGNKSKAREFVNRGLKISPSNYELIQRKRMLN